MNCTPKKFIKELGMKDVTGELKWITPEEAGAITPDELKLVSVALVPWAEEEKRGLIGKFNDGELVFNERLRTRENGTVCAFPECFFFIHEGRVYRHDYPVKDEPKATSYWSGVIDKYELRRDGMSRIQVLDTLVDAIEGGNAEVHVITVGRKKDEQGKEPPKSLLN